MEKSKSQIVLDEIGYNVSNEVLSLVRSLDGDGRECERCEGYKADILELEAEVKRLKRENAKLIAERDAEPDIPADDEQE